MKSFLLILFVSFSAPVVFAEAHLNSQVSASRQYIDRVLLDSRVLKRSGGKTFGHMAMIFDRTAEKIEDLDTLDVEAELIDWGHDVAKRLRNVGLMFRDIGMQSRMVGDTAVTTWGYSYWGYYHAYWQNTYYTNQRRRVLTYDAARFKFEQYNEIRAKGVALRRQFPN